MGNSSASCISSGKRGLARLPWILCKYILEPTLQRGMKGHGADTNHGVAHIGQYEDWWLGVFQTVPDPYESQVQKHQVGKRVHELSAVMCDVVILHITVSSALQDKTTGCNIPPHTN